ncbi:MAG: NAD-dependent epimerase/dehydratase family protein [Candidatus Brocadiia bacterium]
MKVLVTGASGHLGPFVVAELAEAGHEPVLMCRSRPPDADRWLWVQGDVRNFEDCLRATQGGVEAIQHLGAMAWPTDHPRLRPQAERQGIPFDATIRTNVLGTYNLLQAAVARDIGLFVMAGSNCALGHYWRISGSPFPFRYLPVDERHPSCVEDSYSFSKLATEELLASYHRAYGLRTYVTRPCGIYTPDARARLAREAAPARHWSDVLWLWVGSEDVASAHRLLMEQARRLPPHDVFFCNAGDTTALEPTRELLQRFRPELLPLATGLEGHAALISSRKLREAVGWEPRTSWRELRPGG